MEYDRAGDSYAFDFEPNGISIGSKNVHLFRNFRLVGIASGDPIKAPLKSREHNGNIMVPRGSREAFECLPFMPRGMTSVSNGR